MNELDKLMQTIKEKSNIILIIGGRGEGKTALGLKLCEELKESRKVYVIQLENTPFQKIDNINQAEPNSTVLIDEASLSFDSRRSMSSRNVSLSELIMISRHNSLNLIFIAQNSTSIDKRIVAMSDIVMLKKASFLQEYMERSFIKRFYQMTKPIFDTATSKDLVYIFSNEYQGVARFPLPLFWTDKISMNQRKGSKVIPNLFKPKALKEQKVNFTNQK